MAFYTAYFDESGHEGTPLFTFAGLVLDVEDPSLFAGEWSAAISPLDELHTSPFLAGGVGYEKWNSKGIKWKQALLMRAARVIAKHSYQTFSISLDMGDFGVISKEQSFDRAIAYPYAFCARFSAVQVGQWSIPNSIPSRVKMVFEHRSDADVLEAVRVFTRDNLDVPIFDRKYLLPLQAADLLALIYSRKDAKKENFVQVKPVYGELNQGLHTKDNLGRVQLRSIWNRIKPLIIERPTPHGQRSGIYFESETDKPRIPFRKMKYY